MSFWIGKKKRKKVLNIMNCNTLYEKNLAQKTDNRVHKKIKILLQ